MSKVARPSSVSVARSFAAFALTMCLLLVPVSGRAQLADEHSVDAIAAALQTPMPAAVQQTARELDDQMLSSGVAFGSNVYLVTDSRLERANAIITRLLVAAGQNPNDWVVRVLDTNPPKVNAFVLGGRYVYVYAALIDYVASDDELAFILAHEIGHSLLLHNVRKAEDVSTTVANLAVLIGAIWKKNRQAFDAAASGVTAAYSRLDEEEADTMGAVIARRAGFSPLHGASFFARMKQQADSQLQAQSQALAQYRVRVQQTEAACAQDQQLYRYPQYRTPANYQIAASVCQRYQVQAAQYNQAVQAFNVQLQQQSVAPIYSDHPSYDNRIGAVAAATDYLSGRRDLESLHGHEQTFRVLSALREAHNPLLAR